jgi:N-acetylneuraminic acid mutarotase
MPRALSLPTTRRAPLLAIALLASALYGCSSGRAGSARSSAPPVSTSPTSGRGTAASGATTTTAPDNAGTKLGQRYEPSLPVARQEGAAAVVGDRLYVVGGYDSTRNSTNDVFVFGGAQWRPGPPLPIRLNHPAAAALGGRVYVVGGFTPDGATDRAFVLSAGASAWREIAPLHRARGALALVAFGGRLYAIGGRDRSVEVGVPEAYDPRTNTWTDLPPMTDARNHLAGYVDGSEICTAGGRTPFTSGRIDCFDPATRQWGLRATLPIPTSGAAGAVMAGTTVVAGGEPAGETSIVAFVQMLRAGTWQNMPMLVPRHGTAFARYRGRLWLCGGATAPGYAAVATCTSLGA